MLFDLRGRGRRRTVQAIYLSLAILMGGGLVLFGIGSDQSGGLFDAFSGENSSGSSATESLDTQITAQLDKTRANPKDPAVWAQLATLRVRRAGVDGIQQDGTYTEAAKRRLALAGDAWERHLALEPKRPQRARQGRAGQADRHRRGAATELEPLRPAGGARLPGR